MVPWNQAYNRLAGNSDFLHLFGRAFRQDEFRPYSYALRFDGLIPALQASSTGPNTKSLAITIADWGAPTTNITPGTPQTRLMDFPAGAVILGITSSAVLAQVNPQRLPGPVTVTFPYGPSGNDGSKRELFAMDLEYVDGSPITSGNPIPEVTVNPNSPFNAAPPYLAEALMSGGEKSDMPYRELYVAPGLGINVTVRSLMLPSQISATMTGDPPPNLNVHVVFHTMVPGTVSMKRAS